MIWFLIQEHGWWNGARETGAAVGCVTIPLIRIVAQEIAGACAWAIADATLARLKRIMAAAEHVPHT